MYRSVLRLSFFKVGHGRKVSAGIILRVIEARFYEIPLPYSGYAFVAAKVKFISTRNEQGKGEGFCVSR